MCANGKDGGGDAKADVVMNIRGLDLIKKGKYRKSIP
jgi:hypothetical protein